MLDWASQDSDPAVYLQFEQASWEAGRAVGATAVPSGLEPDSWEGGRAVGWGIVQCFETEAGIRVDQKEDGTPTIQGEPMASSLAGVTAGRDIGARMSGCLTCVCII